ncbi:MAG: hypothetical protein ACREGR_00360 [Minisyncoccia bacterium]
MTTPRSPDKRLSEEEFVLLSIRALRLKPEGFPEQMSTKLSKLASAFQRYFGSPIDETLDRMIKDENVWAIVTKYESEEYRSRLVSAICLESFPDQKVPDSKNPSLYIAGEVPRRMLGAVHNSPQSRLRQILDFQARVAKPN